MSYPKEPFNGSLYLEARDITIACISAEARDLLDTIMEKWGEHLIELRKLNGAGYDPTHYGFAYWLVRYSELIQPKSIQP